MAVFDPRVFDPRVFDAGEVDVGVVEPKSVRVINTATFVHMGAATQVHVMTNTVAVIPRVVSHG